MANWIRLLTLLMLSVSALGAEAPAPNPTGGYSFSFETLLQDAKHRASLAYAPPRRSSIPSILDKLSPEQYRSIHFNPDAGIWRNDPLPFRLELLRAGYNLQTAVTVSTVEDGTAHDLVATPEMFQSSVDLPAQVGKANWPLSGFRVRTRINSPKVWDEFLVFQGASYFRAVAKSLPSAVIVSIRPPSAKMTPSTSRVPP